MFREFTGAIYLVFGMVAGYLTVGCAPAPTGVEPTPSECGAAQAIDLEVGQTAEFQGSSARLLCVEGSTSGQEFVLITTSLAETGSTRLTVGNQNTAPVLGPPAPSPSRVAFRGAALTTPNTLLPGNSFHARLRELERAELSPRLSRGAAPAPTIGPPARNNFPFVGELLTLNAQPESACDDPLMITARVEAVSRWAVVVADVDNPPGGFSRTDYESFASLFDDLIVPIAHDHFGFPSDIDGNGQVIILFTKEVNALNAAGSLSEGGAFTSGFFFSRDLFPKVGGGGPLGSCPSSNEAELLYLLVPDPGGVAGEEIDFEEVESFTNVTIAHEYQHLLNASERLFALGGSRAFEATWLNEALSHAMEELLFYEASGLSPGLDLGVDDLSEGELDVLNDFQRFNFFRLVEFLQSPGSTSPIDSDVTLATRGAAWNFLRYSADRRGGSDAVFFRELIDTPNTGVDNLAEAIGSVATVFDWLSDWSVGLYADNRVAGLPARFWDRSWDNPSLHESAGLSMPFITTSDLALSGLVARDLAAGGSGYFRFAVRQDEIGQIELSVGGGAPPPTLRATVLRTR